MTTWARCRECGEQTTFGATCMRCSESAAIGQRPRIVTAARRDDWLSCATCDGTGVVYIAGPDYFGNYDSGDCPTCHGYGAVPPAPYPRRNARGETLWACCESNIGPTCQHQATP